MDLRAYVRLLLRRWLVFVVAGVLVFAVIGGASFLIPSVYTATAKAVVSARLDSTADMDQRRVAATYVLERMTTYAQAVATESVLAPVVASLDLDATVDELADEHPYDKWLKNVPTPAQGRRATTTHSVR